MIYYEDLGFAFEDNRSSTSAINTPIVDLSDIQQAIDNWKRAYPNLIVKIWKGNFSFPSVDLNKNPSLVFSEYILDPEAAYVVAGVGIVAGKKAYELLSQIPMVLEWSEEPVPLEEQDSEMARILSNWGVNRSRLQDV